MMEQPSVDQKTEATKPEADQSPGPDPSTKPDRIQDGGGGDKTSEYEAENSKSTVDHRSKKSVHWSEELVIESPAPSSMASPGVAASNPYVASSPLSPASLKNRMGTVRDVLGRWGKKVGEAAKKSGDLAGNTWQHLKTSPSFTDAVMGRIAQETKVLAEGGYEKIFRQTFETVPEEELQNSYACYLSTSAGPVMGVLYVSTAKLAFCSDNPLSYKAGDKTEWSYYKVVIPLHQLKAINPSSSRANGAEKFIQVISVDSHEFWYMGFLNYDGAVKCLQEALEAHNSQSV